ncbi:hypothetical protein JMJ35_000930 [Cladonia borealis]|uniref:Rhodopsin domain-containing protein n=1 Tax=Cladonia borealis TaxID=184061 RepID=A0AA39V507_9LECA|nr:hypothetical protein JMJ35_000930 [Cladonia borealis]
MDNYSQYANLPAASPSPGVVSNLDNLPSRALDLYIGMGTCIAVTTVLLALRMYAKLVVTDKPGWEDCETRHSIIIQMLTAVVACLIGFTLFVAQIAVTFTITGPHGALGTHVWDTTIGQYTKAYEQKSLVTIDLYPAAAFFIKLSLFLLYLRLFKPNRFTRWLNYGGIITCGLFYSASIIGNCVMFIPTPGQPNNNSAWLLRASEYSHRILILSVVQSVFGTLSDIYLLVIPIQMIFQLHFPIERKIGVSAVFMIGILAIACSLANLVYRVKELATIDHTWSGVTLYLFCSAELSAGLVASDAL